jgi:hypothetical protein
MEKKIVVCIGTDRAGDVRVRLSLLLMVSGRVVSEKFHSAMITSKDSLDDVRARIEAHLAMPEEASGIEFAPWPTIPEAEWAKVQVVCDVFHPGRGIKS